MRIFPEFARVVIVTLLTVVFSGSVNAQAPDDLAALNAQVVKLYGEGKYADATEIAKQSLELTERKFGPDHPEVGTALNNVAVLYESLGHFADAGPLYQRSLAIREKAMGPEHPDVGLLLNNLALLYERRGRYAEAEPMYLRSLAIGEKAHGLDHADVGTSLLSLAGLYRIQGRYAEAEPMYQRSLAIHEKALGPDHPSVGTSLSNFAILYESQGRYDDAEPLFLRSLAIREKALGADHPDVGTSLNNLAGLYRKKSRYADAEPLFKRSLALREKALGADHPEVGISLHNLAGLYDSQGRYAEAEPLYQRSLVVLEGALGADHSFVATSLSGLVGLYVAQSRYAEAEPLKKRSLAIAEKALGPDHPHVGASLGDLAGVYERQGRYAEAEPLYQRSLAVLEGALGADHPFVGNSLSGLAEVYVAQSRYAEAEPLYKRSLAIHEKAFGPDHPDVGSSLTGMAFLHESQGRYAEAEPLYMRSLGIREKALGPDHPSVGTALSYLAGLYFVQRDWTRAADFLRRSASLTVRRAQRGMANAGVQSSVQGKREADQFGGPFFGLIKVVNLLKLEQHSNTAALTAETFATAQWAQMALGSEAAASLAQMAARGANGNPGLSTIVRERQDLVVDWQRRDGVRTAAVSQPPDKRQPQAEAANASRLSEIDARITVIDTRLKAEFPDYAALASAEPLTVDQVQADLRADEALVLFLDTAEWKPTPEETFVWVVTKTDARWVRSELGMLALTTGVAALRCGLDLTAWQGDGAKRCGELLGLAAESAPRQASELPFDPARAHALYTALFGQVEALIKDKHLLLVPSGPLTQLPFQVLVTAPPTPLPALRGEGARRAGAVDFAAIRWLARDHAITVLPAVSSLKALRRTGKPSAATKPMIGFGNPLLDGPDARFADLAAQARRNYSCGEPRTPLLVASLRSTRAPVALITTRGGIADVGHVRRQTPLPETADELCAVARDLNVDGLDIYLGDRATEAEIKALSARGALARYRIVHFATHGTLAGQLSGTSEPGLILTPPGKATEEDDGYLSAGEIAALKLDADWVILSACNTAGEAGGEGGAEALSGLARAFFYAGARALLVSHWEVNSDATVKLITTAVRAIANNGPVGRAEALRRAMLAMIDKGQPHEAHPAYWAPFIVVGEGAPVR